MRIAPGGRPPTHLHHGDAESLVVLEGNFRIQQGDTIRDVGPGAFVFGAPGVPHGFANISTSTGRLLVIDAPPKIEPYFRALAAHCTADTLTFEMQQELYRSTAWNGSVPTSPPGHRRRDDDPIRGERVTSLTQQSDSTGGFV